MIIILNVTDFPLLIGEGLGMRSKRQIKVTMFAAGMEALESLKDEKLAVK